MSEKTYNTQECIVAFIDVLGASAAIQADADDSLHTIHSAYDASIKLFHDVFVEKGIVPGVKIFSDNIVVAIPKVPGKEKAAFKAVVMLSAIIQVEFLKRGFLTRGGIASGSYFVDKVMVWGKAMLRGYQLESQVAFYPRVVIDPELVGELRLAFPKPDDAIKAWLRQDKDKLFYVNYLNPALKDTLLFILSNFSQVEEQLAKHVDNPKVSQKWLWFSSYLLERMGDFQQPEGDDEKHGS